MSLALPKTIEEEDMYRNQLPENDEGDLASFSGSSPVVHVYKIVYVQNTPQRLGRRILTDVPPSL